MVGREGYDHFMIKEIHEIPSVVEETLDEIDKVKEVVDSLGEINRICFLACGTSYHAAFTGKYLLENLGGIPTEVSLASEFEYHANALDEKSLVIAISQSGETDDTLEALRIANKHSNTLAIVNGFESSMAVEADKTVYTQAGPEESIAATKTYISQLFTIYIITAFLTKNEKLLKDLNKLYPLVNDALAYEEEMKSIANKYKDVSNFFFIGKGYAYTTALEGALKLKEVSYIHSEAYSSGELMHGPVALVDEKFPVVAIAPPGKSFEKTLKIIEKIKENNSNVLTIGFNDEKLKELSDDLIVMDESISEELAPLVYIIPLQLFSYYISILRDLNPDQPRNLNKVVKND